AQALDRAAKTGRGHGAAAVYQPRLDHAQALGEGIAIPIIEIWRRRDEDGHQNSHSPAHDLRRSHASSPFRPRAPAVPDAGIGIMAILGKNLKARCLSHAKPAKMGAW